VRAPSSDRSTLETEWKERQVIWACTHRRLFKQRPGAVRTKGADTRERGKPPRFPPPDTAHSRSLEMLAGPHPGSGTPLVPHAAVRVLRGDGKTEQERASRSQGQWHSGPSTPRITTVPRFSSRLCKAAATSSPSVPMSCPPECGHRGLYGNDRCRPRETGAVDGADRPPHVLDLNRPAARRSSRVPTRARVFISDGRTRSRPAVRCVRGSWGRARCAGPARWR
jgi:hypothetical protein